MPRETINIHSDDPNIFDIKVGWTKDQYMQLGLESFDHRTLVWILYENYVEKIGAEVRKLLVDFMESPTVPPEDEVIGRFILNTLDIVNSGPVSSLWTTPSRHEVNDLIRLLRKARDAAYGKDE